MILTALRVKTPGRVLHPPQGMRACSKNTGGSPARDFGRSRGGEARESPQRALSAGPTMAAVKRTAAEPLGFLKHALSHNPSGQARPVWFPSDFFGQIVIVVLAK